MLRCARCLASSVRQDLIPSRCRWRPSLAEGGQSKRYISSKDLDRELNRLLGVDSAPAPRNIVPPRTDWSKKKKKTPQTSAADLANAINHVGRQGGSGEDVPRRREGRSGESSRSNERSSDRPRRDGERKPGGRNDGERGKSASFGMRKPGEPDRQRLQRVTPVETSDKSVSPVDDVVDDSVVVEDDQEDPRRRRLGAAAPASSLHGRVDKKTKGRGSVHKQNEPAYPLQPGQKRKAPTPATPVVNAKAKKDKVAKKVEPKFKVEREVYIPPISVKVGDLARMVDVRLPNLQQRMRRMGMTEEQCHSDNYLMSEDASLVVMEFGMNPIVDEERSFDIYAE